MQNWGTGQGRCRLQGKGGQEFRQQEVVTVHGEMRPVPPRGLRQKGNLGSPLPLGLAKWAMVLGSGLNFGHVWGGLGPIWKGAARTCRCPGDTVCSWLVQRKVVKALCVPSSHPVQGRGCQRLGVLTVALALWPPHLEPKRQVRCVPRSSARGRQDPAPGTPAQPRGRGCPGSSAPSRFVLGWSGAGPTGASGCAPGLCVPAAQWLRAAWE